MGLVSREWLVRQTQAEGCNNHWIDLVEAVLALSNSSKAVLKPEGWFYPVYGSEVSAARTTAGLGGVTGSTSVTSEMHPLGRAVMPYGSNHPPRGYFPP